MNEKDNERIRSGFRLALREYDACVSRLIKRDRRTVLFILAAMVEHLLAFHARLCEKNNSFNVGFARNAMQKIWKCVMTGDAQAFPSFEEISDHTPDSEEVASEYVEISISAMSMMYGIICLAQGDDGDLAKTFKEYLTLWDWLDRVHASCVPNGTAGDMSLSLVELSMFNVLSYSDFFVDGNPTQLALAVYDFFHSELWKVHGLLFREQ